MEEKILIKRDGVGFLESKESEIDQSELDQWMDVPKGFISFSTTPLRWVDGKPIINEEKTEKIREATDQKEKEAQKQELLEKTSFIKEEEGQWVEMSEEEKDAERLSRAKSRALRLQNISWQNEQEKPHSVANILNLIDTTVTEAEQSLDREPSDTGSQMPTEEKLISDIPPIKKQLLEKLSDISFPFHSNFRNHFINECITAKSLKSSLVLIDEDVVELDEDEATEFLTAYRDKYLNDLKGHQERLEKIKKCVAPETVVDALVETGILEKSEKEQWIKKLDEREQNEQ